MPQSGTRPSCLSQVQGQSLCSTLRQRDRDPRGIETGIRVGSGSTWERDRDINLIGIGIPVGSASPLIRAVPFCLLVMGTGSIKPGHVLLLFPCPVAHLDGYNERHLRLVPVLGRPPSTPPPPPLPTGSHPPRLLLPTPPDPTHHASSSPPHRIPRTTSVIPTSR